MTVFDYKGFERNSRNCEKACLNLHNVLGLGRVKDIKSGMNVSNGCYLMLQSREVTVFTVFELFGLGTFCSNAMTSLSISVYRFHKESTAL